MPFRKEVKEAVVYPPSKRKAPPFKPQRPNKLIRTTTITSDTSENGQSVSRTSTAASRSNSTSMTQDPVIFKAADRAAMGLSAQKSAELIFDSDESKDDDSDDLPDNPLNKPASKNVPPQQQKAVSKMSSPTSRAGNDKTILEPDAIPPDIDQNATIPQRLLLRLLHENFTSEATKIDKHAIAALQQYVDLFVRETVARAALSKKDDVDHGQASQTEVDWLEREDLEKVAGGMLMDF